MAKMLEIFILSGFALLFFDSLIENTKFDKNLQSWRRRSKMTDFERRDRAWLGKGRARAHKHEISGEEWTLGFSKN